MDTSTLTVTRPLYRKKATTTSLLELVPGSTPAESLRMCTRYAATTKAYNTYITPQAATAAALFVSQTERAYMLSVHPQTLT